MLKEGHKRHFYSSIYEALTLQTSHFTNVNLIMRANASSEVLLFRNCDNVFRVVAFFCQASIAISLGTTLDKTQKCTMSIVHERNWSLKSLLGFAKGFGEAAIFTLCKFGWSKSMHLFYICKEQPTLLTSDVFTLDVFRHMTSLF